MLTSITNELLFEILKRLPVNTLLKLRCVCRHLSTLIATSSFISTYSRHAISSSPSLLLRHYTWHRRAEVYSIFCPNFSTFIPSKFSPNIRSYSQFFEIIGCFNGILCLSDTYRVNAHTITLWNPAVGKSITLPEPKIPLKNVYVFVHGFMFNVESLRFKVIRIVYPARNPISPKVELYEEGESTWRPIVVSSPPRHVICELSLQAFTNGGIHWIGYKGEDFKGLIIVIFDAERENFREMEVPNSVKKMSALDVSVLLGFGEVLTLVQYDRHNRSLWVPYGGCYLWAMREYGDADTWSVRWRLEIEGGISRMLGFGEMGEILVVDGEGELVAYDMMSVESRRLGVKGVANSFYLCHFCETLALL